MRSSAQVNIGAKAGLNLSTAKNIATDNNKAKWGANAGILAQFNIQKKFMIQPEVLYSAKGFKFSTQSGNGTLNFSYISIPILAGFRPSEKFTVLLGPELGFLTKANSKFEGTNNDVTENFRKFDLGIDIGIAYTIKNGWGIEFRYNHGFDDLVDVTITDTLGNEIGTDKRGSNRVLQLGLFYKFSLSKVHRIKSNY
jgi:hypothetical protein